MVDHNMQSTFSSFHYSIIIISLLKPLGGRSDYLEVEVEVDSQPKNLRGPIRLHSVQQLVGFKQSVGIRHFRAKSH